MGSWTWAGATSPCASTLFKASISLFSSASIITASSLVQGLVTPAVYHLRMTPPTILNALGSRQLPEAFGSGSWYPPAFVERPGQLATCNGQVREARAAWLREVRSTLACRQRHEQIGQGDVGPKPRHKALTAVAP